MSRIGTILLTAFFLLFILIRKMGTAAPTQPKTAAPPSILTPPIIQPSTNGEGSTAGQIVANLLPTLLPGAVGAVIPAVGEALAPVIAPAAAAVVAPVAAAIAPAAAAVVAPAAIAPAAAAIAPVAAAPIVAPAAAAPIVAPAAAAPAAPAAAAASLILPIAVSAGILAVGVGETIHVINELTADPDQAFKDAHDGLNYNEWYALHPELKSQTFSSVSGTTAAQGNTSIAQQVTNQGINGANR